MNNNSKPAQLMEGAIPAEDEPILDLTDEVIDTPEAAEEIIDLIYEVDPLATTAIWNLLLMMIWVSIMKKMILSILWEWKSTKKRMLKLYPGLTKQRVRCYPKVQIYPARNWMRLWSV